MKTYVYLSFVEKINTRSIQEEIMRYAESNNIIISKSICSFQDLSLPIQKREIFALMTEGMSSGDQLLVYEGANFGRSIGQVLEFLKLATQKKVDIHFVKHQVKFLGKAEQNGIVLIELIKFLGETFASRKTMDDLIRRASGKSILGRPRGKTNKHLKLDQHQSDILKYLNLKISKSSIAKLLNCHPQTLQDWLMRRKVETARI